MNHKANIIVLCGTKKTLQFDSMNTIKKKNLGTYISMTFI